jgi:hypothetical protein
MQLNDTSKSSVVHQQEPVKKLCEALKYLAREDHNERNYYRGTGINPATLARVTTPRQRRHARANKRSAHNNDYSINSNTATANSK